MRLHDIDRIAGLVVDSLGGSAPGLLGCGAVSSSTVFVTYDNLECGTFECGGQASFGCCGAYTCLALFGCPGDAIFTCLGSTAFFCPVSFSCGLADSFSPKSSYCSLP
jgi:hypothetical protein